MKRGNIFKFKAKDISGKDFNFEELRGNRMLIVNTASKCGYTPQYKALEKLHRKFRDENFVVIGFPSNDFGNQEPGTEEEIREFCEKNYGVTFLMMSKIKVKGPDKHPIYKFLTEKAENGKMDSEVKWNFQKYLLDENGLLVDVFDSKVEPDSEEIVHAISRA